MRSLKFRVYSYGDKEYRTDCGLTKLFTSVSGSPAIVYNDEGDRFDIEQFTGLSDRNGKEVYEGDVVKVIGYGLYEVFWRKWDSGFILRPIDPSVAESKVLMLCEDWEDDYEVIGNIHESCWGNRK